jgi:hypothetical protein
MRPEGIYALSGWRDTPAAENKTGRPMMGRPAVLMF